MSARYFSALLLSFDSRIVNIYFVRLRDHLREIEEGVPSPLDQSQSLQSNYRPDSHRYSFHDGSVESSSNGEANSTPSQVDSPGSENPNQVEKQEVGETIGYSRDAHNSQGYHPLSFSSSEFNVRSKFTHLSNDIELGSRTNPKDSENVTDIKGKYPNPVTFGTHTRDAYMNQMNIQDHFEISDEEISLFDLAR